MARGTRALLELVLHGRNALPKDAPSWEEVIRRGREANLLGAIAQRLSMQNALEEAPAGPRAHLFAARATWQAQQIAIWREVAELACALHPLDIPVVFLKGTAYLLAGLPCSEGRFFSDIDILVPKPDLPAVESALMLAGFATTHHHPYDQRYYRRWMHELPPMQHVKRMTILDVHHAIVPETARIHPDAREFFRARVQLDDPAGFSVLSPADMTLHSATHLFHNEDLTHGLRDLVDIDDMLRHFSQHEHFWGALCARATQMELGRPLYYALQWTTRLLGTPIPGAVMSKVCEHAPDRATDWLMRWLWGRALLPESESAATRLTRRALYVRGHWLKMPTPMLAWHLMAKALRREELAK